jgi:hypothetical protein
VRHVGSGAVAEGGEADEGAACADAFGTADAALAAPEDAEGIDGVTGSGVSSCGPDGAAGADGANTAVGAFAIVVVAAEPAS